MADTPQAELYIVRLWDGGDHVWIDVSKPLPREEADEIWNKETKNGTEKTKYDDFDYYRVFPADTRMLFNPDDFDYRNGGFR